MPSHPRILLDCRWLHSGGAGRVTELLLRGLAIERREADWILWGPESIRALAWPGAEVVIEPRNPREWNGQRSWFDIPASDLTLFMHQQRPQRRIPSVTFIHDTIPLRFNSGPLDRTLKRKFLRRVAGISRQIVTLSEYSRRCIELDLGVPPKKIKVVGLPGDEEMAARVAALRRTLAPQPLALYLGLFLPHKNLERLIQAFGKTRFRSEGGKLLLMGAGKDERAVLTSRLTPDQHEYVEARLFASQAELDFLLASCRFLVQPSLEEGFGLPAWEALCCGVPLCVSDGGSLPEITRGWADHFPAASLDKMIEALDACASRAAGLTAETAEENSRSFLDRAPTVGDLAFQMQEVLWGALEPSPGIRDPGDP
jgi:glycosyltransferase involved in cell wall biosynthesis